MKKNILYLFLITLLLPISIFAELNKSIALAEKVTGKSKNKKRKADISFIFKDEDLIDIINMLAAKKDVNIVLPTGANAINAKVNLNINQKLSLDEAWDILYTVLDIAGYSLIPKKDLYLVVKNSKNISRESLPIYINTPIVDLPDTDERVRYVYYLSNIKASQEFDNQLGALFKELLPEDALYKADKGANGILLIAKSQDIKSIMSIVEAMDKTGFQERLEVVRLRYTNADTIAKLFNENILKTAVSTPANRFRPASRDQAATYFSKNVKVISEPRTNSLVVLGRVQAVERVKDFIFKYIDVQLDSGKSILHMYELQYLDADEFAPVLQNIVDASRSGGTEQSKAGKAQVGTERFFDQIVIQPDSPAQASEEGQEGKYFGGNKLVIAARNDDWKRIKTLIEQLDKPQPQVIIEVLIADLTLDDARRLGSLSRNPKDIPFPGEVTAQSAMIDQVVLDSTDPAVINTLRGVNSDLNSITVPNTNPNPDSPAIVSVPQNLVAGTAVIALNDNDGRTWSLLEVLKLFDHTKILSHPHIIATNNQKATIEVGESRLVDDQAAPSTSGITRRKKTLEANTNLYITPRISSANTVNLQVIVDIDQFSNTTDFQSGNRINRDLTTNASIKTGDILALGGLVREETADQVVQTPIISKIPILGWLFKRKSKNITQTSLTIFISPTIIQPKLRGGVGEYTKAYVEVAKDYSRQGALFDNLRDPVTRWFFKVNNDAIATTDAFLEKDATTEALHEIKQADFAAQEEARLLDKEEDNAILNAADRANNLKGMLSNQNNPLKKDASTASIHKQKAGKPITATTIAQKTAPHQRPSNNKQHLSSKKQPHNVCKPCTTAQVPQQKNEAIVANKNNVHDLKKLLIDEANPLTSLKGII